MTAEASISRAILKASKKAAKHEYDQSKYVVLDLGVRRDVKTGRLISNNQSSEKK